MKMTSEKPQKDSSRAVQKYRLCALVFGLITVVGFCHVFGVFDSFTTHILSDPKDYKAEEAANAEEAKQLQRAQFDKLVDETAEQFVNEVEEEKPDTTATEEVLLPEPEPEPEGEEF